MWRKLSHENILSFHGINATLFQLALVYDWGKNGNINQYIESHPGTSRPSLVRNVPSAAATVANTHLVLPENGSCLVSRRGWNTSIRLTSHTAV